MEPIQFSEEQKRALTEFTNACNALKNRVAALNQEAEARLGGLAETTKQLAAATRRNKKIMKVVLISFAIKLVITGFLVAGWLALDRATDEIDSIQNNQGSQLCALYTVFINADTPEGRKLAEKRGDDMQQRDRAFAQIRESYQELGCAPELYPNGTLPKNARFN
jgi:hypothetical protein